MHRACLERGEREVPLDHQRLRDGRPAAEPEFGGHGALVHLAAPRQRRLLAMEREGPPGDRAVRECAAHQLRRRDGHPVVCECERTGGRELGHLGQLFPTLALRDRGGESRRDERLLSRALDERLQDPRGVDHGSRVFGIATIAQYPPAAAAAVPDAIVSSSSRPGVRRCT